jgi:hypothetical protein
MTPGFDPVTLYAAKVAATTTAGALVAAYGAFAETGVVTGVAVGGFGLATIAAGVFKLLSDHTVTENARAGYESRIAELAAETRRLELERDAERNVRHALELAASRLGVELPTVHDLPLDRATRTEIERRGE